MPFVIYGLYGWHNSKKFKFKNIINVEYIKLINYHQKLNTVIIVIVDSSLVEEAIAVKKLVFAEFIVVSD